MAVVPFSGGYTLLLNDILDATTIDTDAINIRMIRWNGGIGTGVCAIESDGVTIWEGTVTGAAMRDIPMYGARIRKLKYSVRGALGAVLEVFPE